MIVGKSFDQKCMYEDVLPHCVFDKPQYVDTDIAASVRKHLRRIYPDVNIPELLKVFRYGDTQADLMTMQKVRLSSIYGEFHNKEDSPEA